ncbi:MAG: hypothetical protein IPJ66_18705 [Bacteroidetes bacterium]|nr:hypothetical protein [Bacteroidota bacterium]
MHKFSKNHFDEFQEWNRRNCKGKEEHIEYLHYMITEQFGFEKPPYNFSSWVANTLMYEHNGIDVLMYPSWKTQFMGCNFAFHPNFIDQYMTLDRVFQMTVKEFIIEKPGSESSIKWSHGKMGFVDRTNIHWKWPSEHEVSVLLNYVGGNYNVNISPTK